MNDVIQILGERWTYVYSSMYYGLWDYNKESQVLSTNNQVSFSIEEIDQKILELEEESKHPNTDPSVFVALAYLQKIKQKIG
jgi:hypothetical protein